MNTTEILAQLIAFPTVSDQPNLDLIDFVSDYLAGHGVRAHLVPDATGKKKNLFATIGPNCAGGVVLSGHVDVVPAARPGWASDPFKLRNKEGRLYGRGSCDMKGFVASILAAVPAFCAAKFSRPVHIALSYDEEVGCLGVPSLIDAMAQKIATPSAVIVGEPTSMQLVAGHKESLSFFTKVHGYTGHSSRIDQGVSAVMTAARLITWLEDRMLSNAGRATLNTEFLPPYTTLHCGMVKGGIAANVIAQDCDFVTDIRALPDDGAETHKADYLRFIRDNVEPKMHAIAPDAGVEVSHRSHVLGLSENTNTVAQKLINRLLPGVTSGVVSYGTEAGFFARQGWSTVVCGPGDIAQAHCANEYIEADQLRQCDQFMLALATELTQ
ncbi:acetylornithine deacetylase [Sulfitobacter sp. F26204]|uniref:acetylornithine deacetylase n=1 Tax=Sulfitobacter sp. F26204 TaxID=2996014 RepID=UPI00225E3AB2|nr:acetylornithine deacetylase [Sulfitobacter sp. F26204]MCX7561452.1 acetylornithine deacetylase [Sulfitobacter sp. F26204]